MSNNLASWKEYIIGRRTTKIFQLEFTKNGIAEDITGWTIYFTAKLEMEDSDANAKISKKITSHSDPTNGITIITLDPDDTDLDYGSYYYSIDFKDDDGQEGILQHGRLKIADTVRDTRD